MKPDGDSGSLLAGRLSGTKVPRSGPCHPTVAPPPGATATDIARKPHVSIAVAWYVTSPGASSVDPVVYYAYQIVLDSSKLTVADALALHALGVVWGSPACQGNCRTR